ncbi:MAG: metallophosphoesterase, partial [Sphaerochaeta sp.]|nr:metallophosphoesterase [Sphaerochaeta sp.]
MKPPSSWILKTVLISLAVLILGTGIVTYLVIDGLTNTRIYQDFDQYTELFAVPQYPFDLEQALQEQKAFAIPYEDDSFTILWG